MTQTGAHLGTVTRIAAAGPYIELRDVAPGFEFGPCVDLVGGLAKGDRIVAQPLARDEDEFAVVGILGGRAAPGGDGGGPHTHDDYVTDVELAGQLGGKAPVSHTHDEYATDVELAGKASASHTHDDYVTDVELTDGLAGKASASHTHPGYVTGADLTNGLAGKAPVSHTHPEYVSDDELAGQLAGYATDTELANGLAGKAPVSHTHGGAGGSSVQSAAGSVALSAGTLSTTISFLTPFTVTPVLTFSTSALSNVPLIVTVDYLDLEFVDVFIRPASGAWTSGAVTLYWHAIAPH